MSYSLTNARLNHPCARKPRALRILIVIGALAAIIGFDTTAFGQACISHVTRGPRIDGMLAFAMGAANATCRPDTGLWGFNEPKDLASPTPLAGQTAKIHFNGLKPEGAPSVQTLYVGISFNKDAQLDFNDKLMLVFDATGNGGAFDNGDFAIVMNQETHQVGPIVATGEACDTTTGRAKLYVHNGRTWGAPQNLPGTIRFKMGWDYQNIPADPENEVFEVEVSIDVAAHGLSVAGSTFRVGARMVVVPPGGAAANVWRFPSTMDNDDNPAHFSPGDVGGTFSAGTLATTSFGNCCNCAPAGGLVGVIPMLILAGGGGLLYRRASRSRKEQG